MVSAQNNRLHVKVDILPQLKGIFKGQEITLILYSDSVKEVSLLNSDTATFEIPQIDSIVLSIRSHIYSDTFTKSYYSFYKIERDKSKTQTNADLKFPDACQYNIQGTDRRCPKCHKTDKVLPICYGLPMYDEKGNKQGPKCYSAGCIVSDCDPNWYCERDALRF